MHNVRFSETHPTSQRFIAIENMNLSMIIKVWAQLSVASKKL